MAEQDRDEERVARFQVTILLPPDVEGILPELDIDVLPQPPRLEGDPGGIVAVVTLEEIDRLVATGAKVMVERKVSDVFPPHLIMSEEEAEARLDVLAPFREGTEG